MQLFKCLNCGQLLYFENTLCVRCESRLGYLSDDGILFPIRSGETGNWCAATMPGRSFRMCANANLAACNWLIPEEMPETLCRACQLNCVIPDLSVPEHLMRWQRLENAKHQLIYALLKMGLPVVNRTVDPKYGLGFVFVADPNPRSTTALPTPTGHLKGVITINIAEADDAERERQRKAVGEPYRTLLGHFRHEIGHYYWERLIAGQTPQVRFRQIFGDEQIDYGDELKRYYAQGAAVQWQDRFVSAYASAHPLEDFAETWAHYMHILDTLETAQAFGVAVRPLAASDQSLAMVADFDPYLEADFGKVVRAWLPLTFAVNSLNRSMGHADLYPFVISRKVEEKLGFIHALVRGEPL